MATMVRAGMWRWSAISSARACCSVSRRIGEPPPISA